MPRTTFAGRSSKQQQNDSSSSPPNNSSSNLKEGDVGGGGVTAFLPRNPSSQSLDSSVASCCSSSLGVGTFSALDKNLDERLIAEEDMERLNTMNINSLYKSQHHVEGDAHHPNNNTTISNNNNNTISNRRLLNDAKTHVGQHPALSSVCVMDGNSEQRIIPNANEAFVLDNDCFVGTVMLLMRTPDVDLQSPPPPPPPTADHSAAAAAATTTDSHHHQQHHQMGPQQLAVSEYFRGKKRRFEFQFQIRLKRVPTGPLFLGCELEHAIKVGTFTKGLVGLLLAMVRRINPGFHYSWGDNGHHNNHAKQQQEASGDYEKTHLSFPVEASMDRIVITKPGEDPPILGRQELYESAESVKRRRKLGVGSVEWNTTDTFTMCLWSAYADWLEWKSINVPGVSPFSLSRVTGAQSITLSVYEITSCASGDYKKKRPPHAQRDLRIYTRLEFSHAAHTVGGLAERVLGRAALVPPIGAHRMPLGVGDDTESVGSETMETLSRVSHITT